ncbi:ChaN family lipoprotein [Paracidovorax sp. MALMAid1276]|uniref:ChaN family lipoprotein n=1 Tax=Paracidovorax sp. MALMAid1276 TaxID=3411631 RepID=UPI003B9D1330
MSICIVAARTAALSSALSATLLVALGLAGCASAPVPTPTTTPAAAVPPRSAAPWPERLQALLPTDVLLLGEQHDAPDHQRLQREAVQWLAERGQLAALVLEMAERGHGTAGLPRDATEAAVQAALQWRDAAWPWAAYGPVVMAAVRAGVPVLGGNLPRAEMRSAMADTRWDRHLGAPAMDRQIAALRDGHCGLLPPSQLAPMARIQIARDAAMADVARAARQPGQTVVLVAGGGHVLRSLGVPTHWPPDFRSKVALALTDPSSTAIKSEAGAQKPQAGDADTLLHTPALPPKDHCAALRQQWAPRAQ